MRKVICPNCGKPNPIESASTGATSFICAACNRADAAGGPPPTKTKKGGIPHALRVRSEEAAKSKQHAKPPRP